MVSASGDIPTFSPSASLMEGHSDVLVRCQPGVKRSRQQRATSMLRVQAYCQLLGLNRFWSLSLLILVARICSDMLTVPSCIVSRGFSET